MIFDSHAHYNDKKFDGIRDDILNELLKADLGAVVNASVDPEDSLATLRLCERFSCIYAAVGIHPSEVERFDDPCAALDSIESAASHRKVVAIGEIGLDYHFEPFDKDKQKYFFDSQLTLAERLGLPVVIHDRDAHGDVDLILKKHMSVKALIHSYSGSAQWARDLVRDGRYLSFSGVVTFKNARRAVEALEAVPLERILLETDCPYLAPEPLRGSLNNSGNITYIAAKIAEIKGKTTEEILKITFENAKRFFEIDQ